MKPSILSNPSASLCAISMAIFTAFTYPCLLAGEGKEGPALTSRGAETEMDLPGSSHKYYGQNVNYYIDKERKVAKIDIDADLNYDGVISNDDPADGGSFEVTPPGLVVGTGEMAKVLLRLRPYRIDFQGDVVVTLEITGINRAVKSGQFESFKDEQASVGRLRVWKDAEKKTLLLDSGDVTKRMHEFTMDGDLYPANLPGIVPRAFYVEGVSPSGAYSGDLRILTSVSYRVDGVKSDGAKAPIKEGKEEKFFKTFRTAYDHMLFTVKSNPMPKGFVNNNSDGVWIK